MKHFIIPFLCAMILSSSCSKENSSEKEVINYIISDLEQYGYFPLHVGNEWDFIRGDRIRIDAKVTIEEQEYFRFVSEGNTNNPTYYRQDGNHIFEKEGDQAEILRYDLGAIENDTWNYYDPLNAAREYTATIVSKTAKVQTENYEFQDCYQYFYELPMTGGGLDIEIFLAKGIGFFWSYMGEGLRHDRGLLRVKIDGKEVIF